MEDYFVVSTTSTSASNSTKPSGNFSKEEEQLLVSLVAQNKHIFENKKSGVISLYICGGREKVGKSKMLIFHGNDSKFHIIPKIL
jgi:hypothetical protein